MDELSVRRSLAILNLSLKFQSSGVLVRASSSSRSAYAYSLVLRMDAEGQQLRYCGTGAGHDDIIVKGDPGEMKFIAYYVKQGKVVAVARSALHLSSFSTISHEAQHAKRPRCFEMLRAHTSRVDALRGGASCRQGLFPLIRIRKSWTLIRHSHVGCAEH